LATRAQTSPAAIAFYERGNRIPTVDTLARIIAACGMELRMEAVALTDADLAQRRTDREVGEEQARANADRFRSSVRSIRPLKAET
jgi:transcriptional regulator with XRE-family HTH domain